MLKNRNSSLLDKYASKEDLIFKNQNDKGTLLLLDQPKENLDILRTIGLNEHIDKVSHEANIKNSKSQLGIKFNKPSFLGSDIKKLCNEYDLTISRAMNYKGSPFEGLPEIIQNFINEHNYETIVPAKTTTRDVLKRDGDNRIVKDSEDNYVYIKEEYEIKPSETLIKSRIKTGVSNWFIMAPRESFDGKTKNNCCTLFYRDNDDSREISESDVFLEIHSWGKSYSDLRKFNYFLKPVNYDNEFRIRGMHYNPNEVSDQSIGFYVLMIILLLSNLVYFGSFNFAAILQTLIVFLIYRMIKKPSKHYLKLWKI